MFEIIVYGLAVVGAIAIVGGVFIAVLVAHIMRETDDVDGLPSP